jgi:hypothetical protein
MTTLEDILKDIAGFNNRIWIAREQLVALPSSPSTCKERKKMNDQRRQLSQEIEHVQRLILMAQEALDEISRG